MKRSLFEEGCIGGVPGEYPLTAENLFRVGLALCLLLQADRKVEKPVISIDEPNFVTLAIGVGFMNGGGTVRVGESADLSVVCVKGSRWTIRIEGLFPEDFRKLEIILFGRTQMPRRKGEGIGRVESWTQEMRR
jgi:hypothetical protein